MKIEASRLGGEKLKRAVSSHIFQVRLERPNPKTEQWVETEKKHQATKLERGIIGERSGEGRRPCNFSSLTYASGQVVVLRRTYVADSHQLNS